MQPSHFDTSSYHAGLYGTTPTYDSTIKLHHGHFTETPENCYNGYLTSPSTAGNYVPRDPPSYSESTMFHSSFVPNSSTSYYKVSPGGRHMDLAEYGISRGNESLLSKQDMLEPHPHAADLVSASHRYSDDETRVITDIESGVNQSPNVKMEHEENDFKPDVGAIQTRMSPHDHPDGHTDQTESQVKVDEVKSLENLDDGGHEKEHDDKARGNSDMKPAMSYIALIAKSILESPQKRLSLGSIYSWIEKNYPYYLNRGQGWRNSVRHNLSLNDCFIKAGRCEDGKGNYWAIHPANIQDFMRGDFRQRRRSRRRGRKKDCDLGMYHMSNGYLGTATSPLPPSVSFNPAAALSSIYSPYTEAERRAYRLDEALLRQSMNNPFMKWYHNSMTNGAYPSQNTSCSSGMYAGASPQWQGYTEQTAQPVYQLNSSFPRNYSAPTLV